MFGEVTTAGEPYAAPGLADLQRVGVNTVADRALSDRIVKQIETTAAEAMADPVAAAAIGIAY